MRGNLDKFFFISWLNYFKTIIIKSQEENDRHGKKSTHDG
jgi:hypothetical protein